MSRVIVIDLDRPDVQALEAIWSELQARHVLEESDRLHLQHQAQVRELQERTPDRLALGSFPADLRGGSAWQDYLNEQLREDPDWGLTCLVASSVSLGFPVPEVIDIALTLARDAGVTDEVTAPILSRLLVGAR